MDKNKINMELHFSGESLIKNIMEQTARSAVPACPENATESWSDRLILSEDEYPQAIRLLEEGYNKIYPLLSAYMTQSEFCPREGNICIHLSFPDSILDGTNYQVEHLLKQCLSFYVLYRWFLERNPQLSMMNFQYYNEALSELRGIVNRRKSSLRSRLKYPY